MTIQVNSRTAPAILAVYNREIVRFNLALHCYVHAVELGNLFAADIHARIVRRCAAAILATIGELTPEGGF